MSRPSLAGHAPIATGSCDKHLATRLAGRRIHGYRRAAWQQCGRSSERRLMGWTVRSQQCEMKGCTKMDEVVFGSLAFAVFLPHGSTRACWQGGRGPCIPCCVLSRPQRFASLVSFVHGSPRVACREAIIPALPMYIQTSHGCVPAILGTDGREAKILAFAWFEESHNGSSDV